MGCWREKHNEEHHNLYTSLKIIVMIKSRRLRWVGDVATMEKMVGKYKT
jgi:hypothetical protein